MENRKHREVCKISLQDYAFRRAINQVSPPRVSLYGLSMEVLCSEYLRREESNKLRIDYLLTPVGRTMKDIDIEGANRSIRIYAQVSLSEKLKEIDRKIQLLRSLSHGYEDTNAKRKLVLVYFGPRKCQDYVKSKYKNVHFISTEEVLNKLMNIGIVEDMIPSGIF